MAAPPHALAPAAPRPRRATPPTPDRLTPDQWAALACPKLASGLHGVYRVTDGRWRAKAERTRNLGSFPTPRAAALAVAAHYAAKYGPDWHRAFRRRFANRVVPLRRPDGSFACQVWAMGAPHTLGGARRAGYATEGEAVAAGWAWARAEFGLFAGASLWRDDLPGKKDYAPLWGAARRGRVRKPKNRPAAAARPETYASG